MNDTINEKLNENDATNEIMSKQDDLEENNYQLEKKADKEKFKNIIKNIKELRRIQNKEKILRGFTNLFKQTY